MSAGVNSDANPPEGSNAAPRQLRLLAIFAHPDDETFLAGALLAKYAAEGVQVELLCAAPSGSVLRRRRLREAASILGIGRVHLLDYEPSHMWPDGQGPFRARHPADHASPASSDGRVALAEAPAAELANSVGRAITAFDPHVVVADSQYGSYGHPDHILVHRAAIRSFTAHARAGSKLYSLAFPRPLVRLNFRVLSFLTRGRPRVGPRAEIDLGEAMARPPKRTAVVNVSPFVLRRRRAASAYAPEIDAAPLPMRMLERAPLWLQKALLGRAALTRLQPPPDRLERDLFEGVV